MYRLFGIRIPAKKHTFSVNDDTEYYEIHALSFSPNGQFIAVASSSHDATIWHTKTGRLHFSLKGHIDEVAHIAFSNDGAKIAKKLTIFTYDL